MGTIGLCLQLCYPLYQLFREMFERDVNSTCDGMIMIPNNLKGLTKELKLSGRNGTGRSTEIPILKAGQALQCSCLENPMDREAWQAAVHGVAEGQT